MKLTDHFQQLILECEDRVKKVQTDVRRKKKKTSLRFRSKLVVLSFSSRRLTHLMEAPTTLNTNSMKL